MARIIHGLLVLMMAMVQRTSAPGNEFSPELMLKPRATVRFLIPANQQAGQSFEMIGERAGINVVFYRGFKPETSAPLR